MPKVLETNPRNIWGRVVLYMKNNSHNALHVICGNIDDVNLENGNFIISVKDKFIKEHLEEKSNFNLLKRALIWQDLSLNLIINLIDKPVFVQDEDIKKLKQLVGEFLTVEEN